MPVPFEKFCIQKGISFVDNRGKRKLHLNKKGSSAFEKN